MAFIVPPIMSMELAKQHLQEVHAMADQSRRIAHLRRRPLRWRTHHLKES